VDASTLPKPDVLAQTAITELQAALKDLQGLLKALG
jgi:hypothetical protein